MVLIHSVPRRASRSYRRILVGYQLCGQFEDTPSQRTEQCFVDVLACSEGKIVRIWIGGGYLEGYRVEKLVSKHLVCHVGIQVAVLKRQNSAASNVLATTLQSICSQTRLHLSVLDLQYQGANSIPHERVVPLRAERGSAGLTLRLWCWLFDCSLLDL